MFGNGAFGFGLVGARLEMLRSGVARNCSGSVRKWYVPACFGIETLKMIGSVLA